MIKSRSVGSVGLPDQGLIWTFLMDWWQNFGWNTLLKFENLSNGSKVIQFQTFLAKNYFFGQILCYFWTEFQTLKKYFTQNLAPNPLKESKLGPDPAIQLIRIFYHSPIFKIQKMCYILQMMHQTKELEKKRCPFTIFNRILPHACFS